MLTTLFECHYKEDQIVELANEMQVKNSNW